MRLDEVDALLARHDASVTTAVVMDPARLDSILHRAIEFSHKVKLGNIALAAGLLARGERRVG